MIGVYEGSGFKEAPYLARRADGQTLQLTALLYSVASHADGQRDHAAIAAAVVGGLRPQGQRRQRALPDREEAAPARRARRRRRLQPRARAARPAARAEVPHRGHPRALHARADHALPAALLAARAGSPDRRVPRARRLAVPRPRHRPRAAPRDLPAAAAARDVRRRRDRHGLPRDRPRDRLPLRRGEAGRHGRRPLHRLAGLLHRRHRRLPAGPRRPPAHRPRRHLLQRRSSRSRSAACTRSRASSRCSCSC